MEEGDRLIDFIIYLLFQEASDSTGAFSSRVFREEGAKANFRVISSLAAR